MSSLQRYGSLGVGNALEIIEVATDATHQQFCHFVFLMETSARRIGRIMHLIDLYIQSDLIKLNFYLLFTNLLAYYSLLFTICFYFKHSGAKSSRSRCFSFQCFLIFKMYTLKNVVADIICCPTKHSPRSRCFPFTIM